MSASSRSRQKRKLEPISIEELAGTTGMSGFCSFLTRDSSVPVPALDHLESGAPEPGAPESGAPITGASETALPALPAAAAPAAESPAPEAPAAVTPAPGSGAVDSGYGVPTACREPESSAPVSPAFEAGAVSSSAAETNPDETTALETASFRYRRKPRVREAVSVEDGHSLAEQAVYDAMVRAGKPYQGDSRILTIGLRTLAELSRMAYSNCKANVRSLVAKRAIEELPGFSYTDGRTYIIHSYPEILRRRKAASLTHVLRTRGVAFVDPHSGAIITGAAKTSAPDSTARETVLEALRKHHPEADPAVADALWQRCRETEPLAEPAEVAHFIHVKAGRPSLTMPISFLLTAVPKCFQGEAFQRFRLERQPPPDPAVARDRELAAEILRNPDTDDEQRQWARSVLG